MAAIEDLTKKEWFHPSMTRQQAEDMLLAAEIGRFVIRPSSKTNCYALSYKSRTGAINHSLVEKTPGGYKLPEENRLYPTLTELLRTCKFLLLDEPPSDHSVAVLSEAFPDTPHSVIVAALKHTRGDVNSAIDYLLAKQTDQVSLSPPPSTPTRGVLAANAQPLGLQQPLQPLQPQPSSSPSARNAPAANNRMSSLVNPIESLFVRNAKLDHAVDVYSKWMQLPRPLADPVNIPSNLESNLTKILQNVQHPMGKKIDIFVLAFNSNHSAALLDPNITDSEMGSKFKAAVEEYKSFVNSLQGSIVTKVQEFNNTGGLTVVWKVLEGVMLPAVYQTLWGVLVRKNSIADVTVTSLLQSLYNVTLEQMEVPQPLQLTQTAFPYSKAVEILQSLTSQKSIHGKLLCLVETCKAIDAEVRQYYQLNPSSPFANDYIHGVNVDDLLRLFTFVLVKAGIPYLQSELSLLQELCYGPLRNSLEGFALATLEACIQFLEVVRDQTSRPPSQQISSPPQSQSPILSNSNNNTNSNNNSNNSPPYINSNQVSPSITSNSNNNPKPASNSNWTNSGFETLKKAEKAYVATLKSMGDNIDALNQLSVYYNTKGKVLKAIGCCNTVLSLDPNNAIARQNLQLFTRLLTEQQRN